MDKFSSYQKVNRNLYKNGSCYYRLFGTGVTPNGCWVINPKMVQLIDIDIATMKDVYGNEHVISDINGTVSSSNEYIKYFV